MTPAEEVVPEKPLAAYTLDSLVAIEMRDWLTDELEADVPLLELMKNSSLTALAIFITERSSLVGKPLLEAKQAWKKCHSHACDTLCSRAGGTHY